MPIFGQKVRCIMRIEEILTGILDAIDEGIHAVNENGITIYYNPKAANLDGLQQKDVIDKHILEVFPSLDRTSSTLLKVLKSQKPIYNQQQTYTNYKGQQVFTVNTTLPIFRQGILVGAVEVSKDITQVKQLSDKIYELHKNMYKNKEKNIIKEQHLCQFGDIIGNNKEFLKVIHRAEKISKSDSTVLITGETGVGKELLVQSIHSSSHRQNKAFIVQNCAALPETLLESILFGTVKGSFTGSENRQGLFELASGGTLFLDEINAMPLSLQSKLLRVLEEKKVRRIGDTIERYLDVRIMAAMNEDPEEALEKGRLRQDLYYRLNVVSIRIPPLRERKDDIMGLVNFFIDRNNKIFKSTIESINNEAFGILLDHDWPGNVRELSNYIERVFNYKNSGHIEVDDLPTALMRNNTEKEELREMLLKYEKKLITKAMVKNQGNISKTAASLSIPRQTLQYKLKQMNIGGDF